MIIASMSKISPLLPALSVSFFFFSVWLSNRVYLHLLFELRDSVGWEVVLLFCEDSIQIGVTNTLLTPRGAVSRTFVLT